MAKFKVLKHHEFILTKVGIIENPLGETKNPFVSHLKSAIVHYSLFIMVTFIISSLLFVWQNYAQLNDTLRSCSFIVALTQSISMFLIFRSNAENVQVVHNKLQELANKSTTSNLKQF